MFIGDGADKAQIAGRGGGVVADFGDDSLDGAAPRRLIELFEKRPAQYGAAVDEFLMETTCSSSGFGVRPKPRKLLWEPVRG